MARRRKPVCTSHRSPVFIPLKVDLLLRFAAFFEKSFACLLIKWLARQELLAQILNLLVSNVSRSWNIFLQDFVDAGSATSSC